MARLTVKQIEALKKTGKHGVGEGLYAYVSPGGSKSWVFRYTIRGESRRREIGLGTIGHGGLTLSDARQKARVLRAEAKAGRDPVAKRDYKLVTFEDAARELHASLSPTFRNDKHRTQWISSLRMYAFNGLGSKNVATVSRAEVLAVLTPIWATKHVTAKRLRQRLEQVFDFAIGKGYRETANPVDGALRKALPRVDHRPKHHSALDWRHMPDFFRDLVAREAMSAACLRFIILTAARSGEARFANWNEVSFDDAVWILPAERMKNKIEHRVPLSAAALNLLEAQKGLHPEVIFPSSGQKPLSVNAFRPLLRRMGRTDITTHGLRSSFRDWAGDSAHAPSEVAEACLAHVKGQVERAYARSDMLDRRRALMDRWASFVTGARGDVVEFVRA